MLIARKFANLRIRTKILLGFGAVLLILAIVGGTNLMTLNRIDDANDTVVQRSKVVNIAGDLEVRFNIVRRFTREFGHTGDPAQATEADAALAKTREVVERGFATMTSETRRAKLREVSDLIAKYTASFNKVKASKQEANTLQVEMLDPSGLKMRHELDNLATAAARGGNSNLQLLALSGIETLMVARLDANKALARHSEAQSKQAESSFASLRQTLKGMETAVAGSDLKQVYDQLSGLAEKYTAAFRRALTISKEIDAAINGTMLEEGTRISEGANWIKQSAGEDLVVAEKDIDHAITAGQDISLILVVLGLVIGMVFAWTIGSMIAGPVLRMTAAMRKLAGGDTSVAVPDTGRHDEIGQMAETMQVFKDNRIAADRLAEEQAAEQAAKTRRAGRIDEMTRSFEASVVQLVGQVSAAATELQATAGSMNGIASQTTQQTASVAASAEQASANVQTVATAAEELAASISEISRQVTQSAQLTGLAVEDAKRTDQVVQALADGAQKIGEVVGLISHIAGQTNLLALNATIEAARAGDAGKGFAVVASEVKGLASQTAKATEDISRQIAQIQAATREAVNSIRAIGSRINEVSEIAAAIAAAMEEQGSATQEIARNVQQAAIGTQEVNRNIIGITDGANNTGAAATQVLGAAGELSQQAEQLSGEVGRYVAGIKAA